MAMAMCMLLGCHSAFAHTIPRKPFISAPKTTPSTEGTLTPDGETDNAQEKAALLKSSSYNGLKRDEEKAFASTPLPIPGDSFSRGAAEEPASTARQKGLLPNSWHDFINQDGFFGDPWGARTWLSDHGITVGGRYFSDSAGNPFGGKSRAARYADEEALSIDFDLKKLAGLEFNAGVLHFLTLARQGAGLGNTLPVINSPMEIYGAGETMRLGRLSWEMHWNHYVQTEFGEINTENDFEQSSTYWGANLYCQFQNNGICGMPQSIAMNSGYGFYPTAHPGAWVKFFPAGNDHYLVQFGVYSVDPTISGVRNGWKMNLHGATGTFLPFQLGWHQGGEDDYSGPLQTNVKVGGYWDTSEVKNVYGQMGTYGIPPSAAEGAPLTKVRGRFGGWFQFDRMLQRDEADPHRGTAFFGSFTWGDPRTAIAPYYMTAGLTRKGTFASRPDDTISLGMKVLWANPKVTHWIQHLQRSGRGAGLYAPHSEEAIELNYGYRPARWLLLRPGLQYLWNPGAIKRYKDAMLIDLETAIAF
ncbi:carbohydrate porin [Bombella saccharophila]|uniref:Carbohydrate porin n=1 Tax=Bombella saccharophila TaxID=2967338 RepID=A0ABT3WAR8_9PROT|nr:carbohydrate porin [Bombella saccharophila]MCX5614879.1 carbohydrate porin [Bombella saccharophila]